MCRGTPHRSQRGLDSRAEKAHLLTRRKENIRHYLENASSENL